MHEDPALACHALRAGAAGHVLRENSFEDLMLALESIDAGATFLSPTIRSMLTHRSSSPFHLFDRLEQQISQQLQNAERVPAAEVHESPEAYEVVSFDDERRAPKGLAQLAPAW